MTELLETQFESNIKFKRVVHMIIHMLLEFNIRPNFIEELHLAEQYMNFILQKMPELAEGNLPRMKILWTEIVELSCKFTNKGKIKELLIKDSEKLKGKLLSVQRLLGNEAMYEIVNKTSKYLFTMREFKKCGLFLKRFLKICKIKDKKNSRFLKIQVLLKACNKAKVTSEQMVVEKNIEIDVSGNLKGEKDFDSKKIIIQKTSLTEKDINAKMKEFERLDLQDQIDKADRYLLAYLKNGREKDFILASKFYEELNKRPATDMEIDNLTNFDIKIGFILKAILKMVRSGKTDDESQFIDIVDLLKSLLEETDSVSTLKCQIVFHVFEYLMKNDISEAEDCELIPKIVDLIFIKYIRRREFENPSSFCKFLAKKLDSASKGKMVKRSRQLLSDKIVESFNFFFFYFLFQAEHLRQTLVLHDNKTVIMSEEKVKRYYSSIRNFLKVIQSMGLRETSPLEVTSFLNNIKSIKLLQSLKGLLCSLAMKCKGEFTHNAKEQALRALLDVINVQTNHHASLSMIRGVNYFNRFFMKSPIDASIFYQYNEGMSMLSNLFGSLHSRELTLLIQNRYISNITEPENKKTIPNLCSIITLNLIKHHLVLSSAMFLFNRFEKCVDMIIASWHLALQNRTSMLKTLPKQIQEKEYSFLLFASLFVLRGYAESLILSQLLENLPELRKLQRYILQFINYFPKHLNEFLISPSLIEEIMSKNKNMMKKDHTEDTLKTILISPEVYQFNTNERKRIFRNFVKVQLVKYFYSIKINR